LTKSCGAWKSNKLKEIKGRMKMKESKIELAGLQFSSNRPYGGEGEIQILAEDIKRNGLINPITVIETFEKTGPGEEAVCYKIVAGRRRVLAVKSLGWKDIPCRILEGAEVDRANEIAGSENINRLSMHPLDEAAVFASLLENGRPIQELCKQYDRTESAIWQRVQLLGLNDGIKNLFREDKIELHAAAMLKSLDPDQQQAFYEKFQNQKSGVSTWDVRGFISKVKHDKLYSLIQGKDCAACQKRTFYNNNALFPELRDEDDFCLDHECYMEKWQKLLSGKIKTAKAGNKSHAEANIIACNDDAFAKIFGKTLTLDGTDYTVINIKWDNRPSDKPGSSAKPCFEIGLEEEYDDDDNETGVHLACFPRYWKEPDKAKDQKSANRQPNPFAPIVKFLELPEGETKETMDALMKKCNPKEPWSVNSAASDIERKVKSKVFDQLIDIIAKAPENENDVDRFLNAFIDKTNNKNTLKKVAGSEKTSAIKKLSLPKMCAALYASTLSTWQLPDFGRFTPALKNDMAAWAGISISQLKAMYTQELKLLIPKAASAKPDHGMTSGKKPAQKPAGKAKAKKQK
jgi:ParB/RepB/Spo0J family partition protein